MFNYKDFLREKYDEIWNSSKTELENNNVSVDLNLRNLDSDRRLGLSVVIPIEGKCSEKFLQVMKKLKFLEPNQYYYPASDFHITVIDFIGAHEDFVIDADQEEAYKEVLIAAAKNISRFKINFEGLTASTGAVMAQGFPSNEMQKLRDSLREGADKHGLELKERYKTYSCHSTIIRFAEKLKSPKAFVENIEKLRHFNFDAVEAEKLFLIVHDWYNRKKIKVLLEQELQ